MDKAVPTDTPKQKSYITLSYDDAPDLRDMKVGNKIRVSIDGEISSISEDSTSINVTSVESEDTSGMPSVEEAKTMPLNKLRERLPKKTD